MMAPLARTRSILGLVVVAAFFTVLPQGVVADAIEMRQVTLVEATDVCVIFPNEFDFPALVEVRAPETVRFRYLGGGGQSPTALLWLPGQSVMIVSRLYIVPAPQMPNHCAIPLSWPE